jgi:DNA-binding transcriptional LysR family regulator
MQRKVNDTDFQVMSITLERLNAFLLVADSGGHARAAPTDLVKQSQLSRQVSELERALNRQLFERSHRGMQLTPAGRELTRVVRELQRGLDDTKNVDTGFITARFGAGDSVLQWLVTPRLPKLRHALKEIELELTALGSDAVERALHESSIDFGILRAKESTSDLKSLHLGEVRYGVFKATGAGQLPLAIALGEPAIVTAQQALGRPALRCDTFPQVAAAVRTGAYAGVLPSTARAALPAKNFEVTYPTELRDTTTGLRLAWRARTMELRPALRTLHAALKTALKLT